MVEKKLFSIRFEPHILAEVKALSRRERRSVNEEVLFILQEYIENYYDKHPQYEGPNHEDMIEAGADEEYPKKKSSSSVS